MINRKQKTEKLIKEIFKLTKDLTCCRLWPNDTARYVSLTLTRRGHEALQMAPQIVGIGKGGRMIAIEVNVDGKAQKSSLKDYQEMIEHFNGVYIIAGYGEAELVREMLCDYLR